MRIKKHHVIIAILLAAGGGAAYLSHKTPPIQTTVPIQAQQAQPQAAQCDPSLWNYVYHPNRLPTKDDCRTVSGTVEWVKHEPDGDFHIRLQEDNSADAPVNSKNIGGFLVAEPICQTDSMPAPTQADAVQGCAQYVADGKPQFPMPSVGEHITITGFYTLDQDHGWMEMHSVSSLIVN